MNGVRVIEAERTRQVQVEQYFPPNDLMHNQGELARAAACYAIPHHLRGSYVQLLWPWNPANYKPAKVDSSMGLWTREAADERIRELSKAGALIAAEIDRLQTIRGGLSF